MRLKLIISVTLLFMSTSIFADKTDDDYLYERLDAAIRHSPEYVAAHERVIGGLRAKYTKVNGDMRKYDLAFKLYEEYKSYMNDSAFVYLDRCIKIAERMKREDLRGNSIILKALQCSKSGMYTEALGLLKRVSPRQLDHAGLSNYYMAHTHVYGELGAYTKINSMREEYKKLAVAYDDSLYAVADKNSEDYLFRKEMDAYGRKDYARALAINDHRMRNTRRYSPEYAIVAYYRSVIYRTKDNPQMAKHWLVESAIADIRSSVMDQGAMWNLANILSKEGDSERSYKYIRFTSDCNNRFNTRMRNWQISPVLSMIDYNYQKQISHTNTELKVFVVITSLMSLLLLWFVFYGYVQNKRLSVARNAQVKANAELEKLNKRLEVYNNQLSSYNERLNESNRIKEEYIGRFLSMCSKYVDKLDDFRRMVNRKIKAGETDDLYVMTKSTELKDRELNELYANFDSAFLNLFPNFVNDFNAMLKPEECAHPTDENSLTTALRIFALIRLGIEDSSKIAEFLHYSVNTIYNYRARVKNGALTDRDSFEKRVKEMGING